MLSLWPIYRKGLLVCRKCLQTRLTSDRSSQRAPRPGQHPAAPSITTLTQPNPAGTRFSENHLFTHRSERQIDARIQQLPRFCLECQHNPENICMQKGSALCTDPQLAASQSPEGLSKTTNKQNHFLGQLNWEHYSPF